MPLVVPGINSTGSGSGSGHQQTEWQNKLLGKKLSDTTTDATNFARTDLPKEHRVLESGSMATTDFNKDRLNVHLGDDGTVKKVEYK